MKNKQITILKLAPHDRMQEITIENSLEALQKEVDGYIEFIPVDEKHALIVNEEGKLKNLDLCLVLARNGKMIDKLVGNVLFVRIKNEDVDSLTKSEIESLKENIKLNMFRCFDLD